MFNSKNFRMIIPAYSNTKVSKSVPTIEFNNEDGRITFNKRLLTVIGVRYGRFMEDPEHQQIAILPSNSKAQGAIRLCTERQKETGGSVCTDPFVIAAFNRCEIVSELGKYHFEGEWDEKERALVFDLKKGHYAGKVKRRRRTSK